MQSYGRQQATPARRGPGPGPMVQHGQPAAMTPQQIQAQRLEEMRRMDAARRISKKPTDREIPYELSDVVVGDGVERYGKLRDTEKQLDAVMMRKRLDVNDNLQRKYTRMDGSLRVWVSNTVEGQPWQVMEEGTGTGEDGMLEFGESSQATFRVRIEGRVLDDPAEEGDAKESGTETDKGKSTESKQRPRFSNFFKAMRVNFARNPSLQPDGYSEIEWRKPQPGPQNPSYDPNGSDVSFDTLEFERKADENINITIDLYREDRHEQFQLSPALAELLDTEVEDRAGAVQGIWEYCRAMKLLDVEDQRWIVCDDQLKKIFNQERIHFPHLPDALAPHLKALPPIQLNYTIRVDKPYIRGDPSAGIAPSAPTIYDLRIPLPNPLVHHLTRFHTSKTHLTTLQHIIATDDDLALLVQKINQTNAKRKFYDNLAKDPTNFVKRWVSSQQRDLEVILAEATRGGGEDGGDEVWKRGGENGVWGSQVARESVGLFLARNAKQY